MQKYFDNITNRNGVALPNATVTVTHTSTGDLATIYSDNGVTTQTNPIQCDINGFYAFYAANGQYTLTIAGAGIAKYSIADVQLDDVTASIAEIDNRIYPGVYSVVPTTRPDGSAIQSGDIANINNALYVYANGVWSIQTAASSVDLANSSNPAKGAALVGYSGSTVKAALDSSPRRAVADTISAAWLYTVMPQIHSGSGDATPIFARSVSDGMTVGAVNVIHDGIAGDVLHMTTGPNTAASRVVADGVLNSTTTLTSATASFTSPVSGVGGDVGKIVAGTGIPVGTTIASVTNSTTVLLSAAATATASGVSVTIGSGNANGAVIAIGVDNAATGIVVRNKYQGTGLNIQQLATVVSATSYALIATQQSTVAPAMKFSILASASQPMMQFTTDGTAATGTRHVEFYDNAGVNYSGGVMADTGLIDWRRTIQTVAPSAGVTPLIRVADEGATPSEAYLGGKTNAELGFRAYRWSGSAALCYSYGITATSDRLQFRAGNGAQNKGAETMQTFIEMRCNATRQMSFFGAAVVSQQATAPVATDLATVITLANALKTALTNLGLTA